MASRLLARNCGCHGRGSLRSIPQHGRNGNENLNDTVCRAAAAGRAAYSTVNFRSSHFADRVRHHQIIAVLPFEMVIDGDSPDHFTAQQIAQIEEVMNSAFPEAYYYRLVHQVSAHKEHAIRIEIQPVEITNRLEKLVEVICPRYDAHWERPETASAVPSDCPFCDYDPSADRLIHGDGIRSLTTEDEEPSGD